MATKLAACAWCRHRLEIDPADVPTVCPRCKRIGNWVIRDPDHKPLKFTENDKRFLKSIRILGADDKDEAV